MATYWLLFLLPVFSLVLRRKLSGRSQKFIWLSVWGLLSIIVGFRHEVGGDWFNYLNKFTFYESQSLSEVFSQGDPLYHIISWVIAKLGGSIHWVNFICAVIFASGVVRFVRSLPLPWLGLLVAIPYMIIVVAMGYTRQATALGFLMLGLASLKRREVRWFVFWVLVGMGFHKSVVLMLPVAALSSTSNRFWAFFWIGCISFIGAYVFVLDSVDRLWSNYVESDLQSEGGFIRVLMNAFPAILYFIFHKRMRLEEAESRLWWWLSFFALTCIPLVMISSTATDRLALYLIPLQLFVFSKLPFLFSDHKVRGLVVLCVVAYCAVVQAVWLFFGSHAYAWLPYKIYLFSTL